jgi:hypothetical protein
MEATVALISVLAGVAVGPISKENPVPAVVQSK